tara:strand:+ start:3451 stop:3909 length:459 start_codon:yes stop_codon:yes gene_type:complete
MKKIIIFLLLLTFNNCNGYQPIFLGQDLDFYIENVEIEENDEISRKIVKRLQPYFFNKEKIKNNKVNLEIFSSFNERVISKDSKGNPLIYEIKIEINVDYIKDKNKKKKNYIETFSINNQSNKFELSQYKKTIENNLVNKIFEKIIIDLSAF